MVALIDHVQWGLGPYQKGEGILNKERTWQENMGSALTLPIYHGPKIVKGFFTSPKLMTVTLTTLAMVSVGIVFYPAICATIATNAWLYVCTYVQWAQVKFFLFMASELMTLGLGLRTYGRFRDEDLGGEYIKKAST